MTGEATRVTIGGIGKTGIVVKHETTTEGDTPFRFVFTNRKDNESYE